MMDGSDCLRAGLALQGSYANVTVDIRRFAFPMGLRLIGELKGILKRRFCHS